MAEFWQEAGRMNNYFMVENQKFSIDETIFNSDSFNVCSVPRPYTVNWRNDLNIVLSDIVKQLDQNAADFLLIDANIYRLYFAEYHVSKEQLYILEANEENKIIETVLNVIDRIQTLMPSKNNMLTVIGGGITQDIGAFAGCIFKRGIAWRFLPTTLLSMCDSCIGAKSGVNYKSGKNQLGLFSAPRQVDICPEFLKTLDEKDILSGYGEILKLLITGGKKFVDMYCQSCDPVSRLPDKKYLKQLIFGALAVKKAVIEKDEFELDWRRSLNYGHTLGHALEVVSNYEIPHGQAVALGTAAVNKLSVDKQLLAPEMHDYIISLIKPLLKNIDLSQVNWEKFSDLLQKDKKTEKNAFVFVLIKSPGETVFVKFEKNANIVDKLQNVIKEVIQ